MNSEITSPVRRRFIPHYLSLTICAAFVLTACGGGGHADSTTGDPSGTGSTPTVTTDMPPAAADTAPTWTSPAQSTRVSGKIRVMIRGSGMKSATIYRDSSALTWANVAADGTSAYADIDTSQFGNGALTLTASAWNGASSAMSGALKLTVANVSTTAATTTTSACSNVTCAGRGTCSVVSGAATCSCANGYHVSGLSCIQDAPKFSTVLGVYTGGDPADVAQFETWLGHKADGVLVFTGNASWTDYDGSIVWSIGRRSKIDRQVLWSIPLIPVGGTLAAAARGDYNDHYKQAAIALAAFRPGDHELYVRTGWEFNGGWFDWTAIGHEAQFIGAYRQFVATFRSVSNRFAFEWNVAMMGSGMDPASAYPGDDYVDVIGMDFYWNTQWDPADPIDAWNLKLNNKYGLQWHQNFAAAHNKPTAYSEWGVNSDNAAPYIDKAKAWFAAHESRLLYQAYWNSNLAFPGKLSDGQYPKAAAQYKKDFGGQ